MAHRIDRGELAKPVKLENGWLRIDGRLTRTGVFSYRLPDGKVRRELRLPDEVFKNDALQSFALVPVTDEHPPVFLDAKNTREFSRGSVGATLRKDGEYVTAEMLVTDAELIEKLEKGKAREVSCGYSCDLEESSGEYQGERYDAIQRNIRGNHVAIVERGRAGRDASVRMDAGEQEAAQERPATVRLLTLRTRDADDDQPRDAGGRWASAGGGGGGGRTPEHLKKIVARNQRIATKKEKLAKEIGEVIAAGERDMALSGDFDPGQLVMVPDEDGNTKAMTIPEAVEQKDFVERQAATFRQMEKNAQKEAEEIARRPPASSLPARNAPEAVAERTRVELEKHEKETTATFQKMRQLEKWGTGKPEADAAEIASLKRILSDQENYGRTLRDRLEVARSEIRAKATPSGRATMNPRMRGSDS